MTVLFDLLDAHPRRIYGLTALVAALLLLFGLYLQHVVGLEPCPMCIVQRYAFVLVALLAAAVLARGPIMAALPQVTPLYVMLHLAEAPPEALPDLIIRNQQGSSKVEGGQTLVVLPAEVYNPAGKAHPLRPIRIAMRDADKKVITEWTVTLGPPEIGPGASLPLVTQQAVQPGMRDLEVNFLPK